MYMGKISHSENQTSPNQPRLAKSLSPDRQAVSNFFRKLSKCRGQFITEKLKKSEKNCKAAPSKDWHTHASISTPTDGTKIPRTKVRQEGGGFGLPILPRSPYM